MSSSAADCVAAGDVERGQQAALKNLAQIAETIEQEFQAAQRVLSFAEYLKLFASQPARYGRSAAHYVRDMFLHYGTRTVDRPWGTMTRFKLFDAPWEDPRLPRKEPKLIGHEALQEEIYRVLCNFVKEGRANRLLLTHGPNGSAKTTAAQCILRALEAYSQTEEGALYRFHWIFPTRKTARGGIGFGAEVSAEARDSYAHLDDDEIDARLASELRDHPLFLLPVEHRRGLLDQLWQELKLPSKAPEWLYVGELSHRNKQIYEALLASYGGSLTEVLRHVQVERYFISRRYRVGAITLGPEMSVDAGERQITADRSVTALPTSLQATTLFETHGELVEAEGGVLELSDLLKRPIDAFRYLQLTLESGEVSLSQQTVFTNLVMIGSANDIHLTAFRQHPEFGSFQGRLELLRVPYLRSYLDEEQIYITQIAAHLSCHVAPHATRVAAEFAVLTRMRRPDPKAYDGELAKIVAGLTAVEKLVLYAEGTPPKRLSSDQRKILKANIGALYTETDAEAGAYEGLMGASPREMRAVLLDAAQSPDHHGLSPFGVLKELGDLCKRADFGWLQLEPAEGGYHDHRAFRDIVRERLLDRLEADVRIASELIDDQQYNELFGRYVNHVSAWIKGEKIRNSVTGKDEAADERMMGEVEALLAIEADAKEHRNGLISRIAAWAIDHPGESPALHQEIFPHYVEQLQAAAFAKLRKRFSSLLRDAVTLLRHDGVGLEQQQQDEARRLVERLGARGYNEHSALDACSSLIRERFADVVG